jgi:hypothetical protein
MGTVVAAVLVLAVCAPVFGAEGDATRRKRF